MKRKKEKNRLTKAIDSYKMLRGFEAQLETIKRLNEKLVAQLSKEEVSDYFIATEKNETEVVK